MRFPVFLTGSDTAEHRAYHHPCVEHYHVIQKAEYSGHCLGTARACPRLLYHVIPCLLEYGSGSPRCMLVANPINLSSRRRSVPADLVFFLLFLLRSAVIMAYLTDTPSAFVMYSSDATGRLPAANSAIASTTTCVFMHGTITRIHSPKVPRTRVEKNSRSSRTALMLQPQMRHTAGRSRTKSGTSPRAHVQD